MTSSPFSSNKKSLAKARGTGVEGGVKMTEVQHEKELFVECKLYPLLDSIDHNILYADYVVEDSGEEYVKITYAKPLSERRIRVTGDSLQALTIDVLKRI